MITAVRGNDVVLGTSSAFQHAPLLITRFLAEPVEMDVPKSRTIGKIIFIFNLSIAATRFRKKSRTGKKERMAQFSRQFTNNKHQNN
jgi:hypothetical protein